MRFGSVIIAISVFVVSTASTLAQETYSQITVTKLTKQEFLGLHDQGLDVIEYKGDSLEIIATPADLEWLENKGIPFDVDIPDLKSHYKSRNRENLTMGGFRTFTEIVDYLEALKALYPTLITDKFSIGQSIDGNEIWAMKISDNPEIDEDEPEILYASLIHAREPASAASVLHFMEHMLSNYGGDSEVTYLVDNRELYFIPVQNPDGYLWNEFTEPSGGGLWRKNRRVNPDFSSGVDLNRNFGFQWGYDNVGSSPSYTSETYRGSAPFSEPETQAFRDFVISRNFVIIHHFHTYSDLELWSPGYDREFSTFDDFYKNVGDSMTQFNNYTPQVGWRLYPTNGAADDWCWGDTVSKPQIISLTCEIGGQGDGFWPFPANIFGLVSENIWPNLFLARIAENPYVVGPPVAPTAIPPDIVTKSGNYTISWTCDDTLNPPANYLIYELTDKSTVTDDGEADYFYWTSERFVRTTARAHSGSFSWTEQAANRMNHWLLAKTPYEVKTNDTLKFWIWYNLEEDWDYFYAQVSTDGGFSFENLANNLTTNFNPNGTNVGNGITGSSGDWVPAKFDLSAYAGQQIIVRLSYFTDNFSLEEGVYIDDIENVDFFGTESVFAAAVPDTFYSVIDKEPGYYWYRLTAKDAEDQVSRSSNLVSAVVPLPYIVGDANGDTVINILDLTFLVDRFFRGGPLPNPVLAGDCNCDEAVNILDLTFMVDYIFRSGPLPSCPV
ncbi:MAG: M14 family zinc carboxypeptidase [Candidatus Zixiibacteriota bacterium]